MMMSLIKQYFKYTQEYKEKFGEKTIVYIQIGAFFEVYGLKNNKTQEITGSHISEFSKKCELNISDKKICVGKKNVIMAGFRDYQLDKYIKKLNKFGYTIVVYTQDIQAKNTTRSLFGIYSPGTFFDIDECVTTNHIMCLKLIKRDKTLLNKNKQIQCGLSTIDIITGKTYLYEYQKQFFHYPTTYDEIERFYTIYNPHELIIIYSGFNEFEIKDIIRYSKLNAIKIHIFSIDNDIYSEQIKNHEKQTFQFHFLKKFFFPKDWNFFYTTSQFQKYPLATASFCFLLEFIHMHNPDLIKQIIRPQIENNANFLILANHSLKQLNIQKSNVINQKIGSVSSFLNDCKTPMGRRRFNNIILHPITNHHDLEREYAIISYIKPRLQNFAFVIEGFKNFRDLQKIYRKIILHKITPAEIIQLYKNLKCVIKIHKKIKMDEILNKYITDKLECKDTVIHFCKTIIGKIDKQLDLKIAEKTTSFSFIDNIFLKGNYVSLDKLVEDNIDNTDKLTAIQKYMGTVIQKYDKKKTIKQIIKIHTTEKSGISLIATKRRIKIFLQQKSSPVTMIKYFSNYHNSEKEFCFDSDKLVFTKTIANNLKLESPLLNILYTAILYHRIQLKTTLEIHYKEFIKELSKYQKEFQNIIDYISLLDVIMCKAAVADKYNFCCPVIDASKKKAFFSAKKMRHCLIEHLQHQEIYVPNDVSLGDTNLDSDGILLYGTNAVGKSSLIRSIGICIILAQSGMFVPCESFVYKPYASIFTRILGNDDIFKGLSTFAVEMSELRTILEFADENSLILGDELCKGTETHSAISIFASSLIKLQKRQSSFIFATHFHELAEIDEINNLPNLKMMHMEVFYDHNTKLLIYNRKLKMGRGQRMYGLEVCKSLDMPQDFLELAYKIRKKKSMKKSSYNSKKLKGGTCEVCQKYEAIDIHHLKYQSFANETNYIETFHKDHIANLINICKKCHDEIHKKKIILERKKTNEGYKLFYSNNI